MTEIIGLIVTAIEYANKIYEQAQLVHENIRTARLLAERISFITPNLQSVMELDTYQKQSFLPLLEKFIPCLQQCYVFIKSITGVGVVHAVSRVYHAKDYDNQFIAFNIQIDRYSQQLQTQLHLHTIALQQKQHERVIQLLQQQQQQLLQIQKQQSSQEDDVIIPQFHADEAMMEAENKDLENVLALLQEQMKHTKNEEEIKQIQHAMDLVTHRMNVTTQSTTPTTTTTATKSISIDDSDYTSIDPSHVISSDFIASGSFGRVSRCVYLNQILVKKQLNKLTSITQAELVHEVSVMSKLHHPTIASFAGANLKIDPYFILMEYCSRGSLDKVLEKEQKQSQQHTTPLTLLQRLRILRDVAVGLSYLHSHNPRIIHRDLKSANILIRDDGSACITDFGLAKLKHDASIRAGHTNIAGTCAYMAPEVLDDEKRTYTVAVDIYAFGIIMWEIATGRKPWPGKAEVDLIELVLEQHHNPTWNEKTHADDEIDNTIYPSWYITLMKQCWNYDPKERPTARKLADQFIQHVQQMEPSTSKSSS